MAQFDKYQLKVLNSMAKNTIVLAGAGSGKTTTMIGRVAKAVDAEMIRPQVTSSIPEHTDPNKIVIASFTNAAADTFRTRLAQAIGGRDGVTVANTAHISTLDHLAGTIIRRYLPKAHYDESEWETCQLIYNEIKPQAVLDEFPTVYAYHEGVCEPHSGIDWSKRGQYYEAFLPEVARYQLHMIKTMGKKAQDYSALMNLKTNYYMAIGLMLFTRTIPDIELMVIDEMQDSSDDQFMFFRFLRQQLPNMKLMMVGDLSQSLYRWRDAKPTRIKEFSQQFDTEVLTLPNNYRSQTPIIRLANRLLDYNLDNRPQYLQLTPASERKPEIDRQFLPAITYINSLPGIAARIQNLLDINVKPQDIAILTRGNKQIETVQDFFAEKYPKFEFTGPTNRVFEAMQYSLRHCLYILKPYVSALRANPVKDLLDDLADVLKRTKTGNGYESQAEKSFVKLPPVDRTLTIREQALAQADHLEIVCEMLQSQLDNVRSRISASDNQKLQVDKMTLTTVHKAKGMEYKYVFYLPRLSRTSKENYADYDPTDLDSDEIWGKTAENQNIHYVAVTRAIDKLCIVDLDHDKHFKEKMAPILTADGEPTDEYDNVTPEFRLLTDHDDPDYVDAQAYLPTKKEKFFTKPTPTPTA